MAYISQIYFQDVQGTYFLSISEFPGSGSCAGLNRRSRAKRDQREWLGHGAKKQQLHFLIAITFLLRRLHFLPPNQPMPKIMQRWVFKVIIYYIMLRCYYIRFLKYIHTVCELIL